MNLIEQLGGYEKAKNIRLGNEEDWMFYSIKKDWYSDIKHDESFIFIDDLKYRLLEYRKVNNIFEVDDLVVEIAESPETSILKVIYMSDCLMVCENDRLNASYGVLNKKPSFYVRHATDEEVKAGHRL